MLIISIFFRDKVTSDVSEEIIVDVKHLNFAEALEISQSTLTCELKKNGLYKCSFR